MTACFIRGLQDVVANAVYECAGICIPARPIKIHLHRNNVEDVHTRVAERRDERPRFAVFMNETAPVSYQQASFTTQWEHRSVPSGRPLPRTHYISRYTGL